jgi:hypothetical protein
LRVPRIPIPRRHFVLPSPLWLVLAPAVCTARANGRPVAVRVRDV